MTTHGVYAITGHSVGYAGHEFIAVHGPDLPWRLLPGEDAGPA